MAKITNVEFVYWLQGFFEIAKPENGLNKEQVKKIKDKLDTVFEHEAESKKGKESSKNKPKFSPSPYDASKGPLQYPTNGGTSYRC